MADTTIPFVAISGLAVGITATTVISDSAAIPVAVSSFNGSTGAVTGVGSFNGSTGAVTGVASVNGSTGAVTNIAATNVAQTFSALQTFTTGITASGLTLTGQFNITSNTPALDEVLTCYDTNGQAKWNPAPIYSILSVSGTRQISPITMTIIAATSTTAPNTNVHYLPFLITGTRQVKVALYTNTPAPTVTGTYNAKVYNADPTTGRPSGSSIGDFGTVTVTASANTSFASTTGVTLSPGMYWVGLNCSANITNLKRWTADTTGIGRIGGLIGAAATPTYIMAYTETLGVAGSGAPASVGSVSEVLSSATNVPGFGLLIV